MDKINVKKVLKKRIIICVQILLMYILGLLIGHSLGNTPPANMYTWRFYVAKGTVETILPLLILIKAKELITLLLDYFCMATMERELVIRLKEELIIGFFQEYRCEILSDKSTFLIIREFLYRWSIVQPIWLDKKITDIECMIAHTYRITVLRFTHLVVNVQEISNMQAIQEQLEEAEAGVYETNKNIELIQSQIHDSQRKYAIRWQKYEETESQSQKELQLSCMEDIKKEIEELQLEMEKQIKVRRLYERQQKLLEDEMGQMKTEE